ncbi:MAG TPA: MraY family glycosyltransferase [Candidatus Polarisedimenticolia bacterium]|nr:MraY family glycosyltransferase [Candidatus Polarisedimenticolia bacterium]
MSSLIPLPLGALCCFLTALVLSLYATPLAARAAVRFGIVDQPDGELKRHRGPVPYLGGLAVFGSFLLTMAMAFTFDQRVLGLLLAGTLLVLLGLIDDFGALGVWPKFLGQGLATVVLVKSGVSIQIGVLPGWVNTALTVLWIVGMTNALNIIDIMDGLAAGTAAVASVFLLAVAGINGQAPIVLMTATLVGSLLGFLAYNRHPARIFLGDTGSLFIGMMLGALAMVGQYDAVNPIGYLTPLLILGVPIFDTLYVMSLRALKRRNPFKGSPDHFALRLKRLGMSVPAVTRLAWGLGTALGAAALVNLFLDPAASLALLASTAAALALAGAALACAPVPERRRVPRETAPEAGLQEPPTVSEEAAVRAARLQLAQWRRR